MDRQTATRQPTTEVRSDNVATVQVHHHDPEPRAQVLLSEVKFRGARVMLCAMLQGNPRFKIQEGWPLPSRASNQTLDKAYHGNPICAPSRSMTGLVQPVGGSPEWRSWTRGTSKKKKKKKKKKVKKESGKIYNFFDKRKK